MNSTTLLLRVSQQLMRPLLQSKPSLQQILRRSSTTTEESTVESNWERTTKRLLERSEEHWSPSVRHEAMHAIQYNTNALLLEDSFALLDRLVVEEEEADQVVDLANTAVSAWQKDNETPLEPRFVFDRLEAYRAARANIEWNAQTYTMVLDVAVKRGSQLDEGLVQDILTTVEAATYADPVFYSTLMSAYAKLGDVQQAELLLKKLKASDLISSKSYLHCISAHANAPSSGDAQRAEELLEEMNQSDNSDIFPTTEAFGAVLNAWAKSKSQQGGERAYAILQSMQESNDNNAAKANNVAYATVMNAFAQRGQALEAEQVLHELIQTYESTGDSDLEPTVVPFSIVIDAWSKSRHPQAATKAEAILERMLVLSQENPAMTPNVFTYNGVLHAWAQSRNKKAPERAEAVLHQLQNLYEQSGNDPSLKPNRISMSTVMDCWAKLASASRAESILNHMIELYKAGDADMKPDIVCFTTVMNAHVKQRGQMNQVPEKVNELFIRMQTEFGMEPNVYAYAIAIHAWARHGSSPQEAVQRAEGLFRTAHREYHEKGNLECKPNVVIYNSLLDAYSKASMGHKAQQLLDLMEESDEVTTNTISFNAVLAAWSKTPGQLEKAEVLLDRMRRHSEISPDVVSFGSVIAALVRSKDPRAADRALAYLDELKGLYQGGDKRCKPSVITFSSVIHAVSKNRHGDRNAELVMQLLDEMKDFDVKPNAVTYRYVLEALIRAKNRASTALSVLQQMERQQIEVRDAHHLLPILNACARTKGDNELKREALAIAKQVFHRMENPGVAAFEYMILIAGIASDSRFAEEMYETCKQQGFGSDRKIRDAIQKVAPR